MVRLVDASCTGSVPVPRQPDLDLIAKEINGYDLKTGKLVPGFAALLDDGSTSSGNWIYSGFYP
ncbi:MAG: hypothetical protein ACJ72D_14695, partial [Marmoricola sp.]